MSPSDPNPRQGPRPLGLHLSAIATVLLSSPAGLTPSRLGLLPWKPELRSRAAELEPQLASADPGALAGALDREIRRRLDNVLTGIERYRRHPYRRRLPEPPVVWREGASRLLDFGGAPDAVPTLFVPSLVNRWYILDLSDDCSLMRWLAAHGIRPLVLDWGRPGDLERRFTLTDYIAGRLDRALEAAVRQVGGPVVLAGYCMGGLLTTALAGLRPERVRGLVAMAAPWDFHAADRAEAARIAAARPLFEAALESLGELPTDGLQALFALPDPYLVLKKFSRFAQLDPDGEAARTFVALEDWLNDGVPLGAPVARECLDGWYGRNEPGRGAWLVAGRPVEPEAVDLPALAVIPAKDRIVPPASARALAERLPRATRLEVPFGHIGMVTSRGAVDGVWEPMAAWIRGLVERGPGMSRKSGAMP